MAEDLPVEMPQVVATTSGKPIAKNYVGMPAGLYLEEFGNQVWFAFGDLPYLVGSATQSKQWRDVDIRLILDDAEYERLFGHPDRCHQNGKWVSFCMAYSALGKHLTGLPIDFQIQQQTDANKKYKESRIPIGIIDLRIKRDFSPTEGK